MQRRHDASGADRKDAKIDSILAVQMATPPDHRYVVIFCSEVSADTGDQKSRPHRN